MTPDPFASTPGQPRNPARIDIVLTALRAYWNANPDLRMGQIVVNAAGTRDPYNVEDDALMAAWPAPPETPTSDLVGLAARGQADQPVLLRSCVPCRHNTGRASWTCPARALMWAKKAGMQATDTEWPPDAPACSAFRVRA